MGRPEAREDTIRRVGRNRGGGAAAHAGFDASKGPLVSGFAGSATFSGFELRRITPADIQAWVSELVAAGYAPETVHKAHALLQVILTAAVDSDLLARSPARGVKLPRIERREMRFLTPSELSELLEAVQDRYRLLVKTAAYTGLRFGELAGLRHGDLEPLRRSITVRRGLVEVSGHLHVEEPKTPASRRTVAIPAWLGEELAFHLAGTEALYVFTGPSRGAAATVGFPVPYLGACNGAGRSRGAPFP